MSPHQYRSNIKILVASILILSALFLDAFLMTVVENSKRQQARFNLDQVKYCYASLVETFGVSKSLSICIAKSKTSFTGDAYALDADTLEFISETSSDVPRTQLFFNKESVGKYFADWESGSLALRLMLMGKDSIEGINTKYLFDDDWEWLEWKYLPDEVNDGGLRIVVVQGTQKDEVYSEFYAYRIINGLVTFIIVLLLLVGNARRREDDDR